MSRTSPSRCKPVPQEVRHAADLLERTVDPGAANAQATRTVVVQDRRAAAAEEQKALSYRRAISACLDARGYSVK